MKAFATLFAACLIVTVVSTAAVAQYSSPTTGYGHYPYHGGHVMWHHHASTAAEGYARGIAAMIHAQGVYNRLSAEARIAHAQAYSHELANHQQRVDTYFSARATNRQALTAERGPRPTAEQLARMARGSAPSRLGDEQLDPNSGQIAWPAALQAEKYAQVRAQLEQLFAYRAATGSIDTLQRQQAQDLSSLMLAELKNDIRQVSPMEYTHARRFLNSLAYEAQLPVA